MSDFDPVPSDDSGNRWRGDADTFDRVYDVLVGTPELTSYAEIAVVADCSPNAARKHLERLTEMGIARADRDGQPARFARNEAYLEWQEANRIARELTVEDIVERVRELEAEREVYEEQFDATDPGAASALDAEDHDAVHERMAAIADWESVDRDVRIFEFARRIARNDGHLVSA